MDTVRSLVPLQGLLKYCSPKLVWLEQLSSWTVRPFFLHFILYIAAKCVFLKIFLFHPILVPAISMELLGNRDMAFLSLGRPT